MPMTFAALCDAMDASGVDVLVDALDDGRHALRLVDFPGCRSITQDVREADFDAAATVLCCSLALCAVVPGIVGDGPALARRWPELVALAG